MYYIVVVVKYDMRTSMGFVLSFVADQTLPSQIASFEAMDWGRHAYRFSAIGAHTNLW